MSDTILGWAFFGLGNLAVVFWLWWIYAMPRGPRIRCPGQRLGWTSWFNLFGWFTRGYCWHDLTGLTCDEDGAVRCPECGRLTLPTKVLRDGRRLRKGRLGVVVAAIALAAGIVSWSQSGIWCRPLPTLPLIALAHTNAGAFRTTVRKELAGRITRGSVTGFQANVMADILVVELRNDGTHWNADQARKLLQSMWPDSETALEQELVDGDGQSRPIAAALLRNLSPIPSTALLEACVKDLEDDRDQPGQYLRVRNASSAAAYLIVRYPKCREMLHAAMHSDDDQQRFISAGICAFAGDPTAIMHAVPILTEHLKDNDQYGDGLFAAPALFRFGPQVIPALRPYQTAADLQLRQSVLHIIERLEHPHRKWDQCENQMPKMTSRFHDELTIPFASAVAEF